MSQTQLQSRPRDLSLGALSEAYGILMGFKIKECLAQHPMIRTMEQLCQHAGLPLVALNYFMKGANISRSEVIAIALALDADPAWLCFDAGSPPKYFTPSSEDVIDSARENISQWFSHCPDSTIDQVSRKLQGRRSSRGGISDVIELLSMTHDMDDETVENLERILQEKEEK